jgi:hypothetical protein
LFALGYQSHPNYPVTLTVLNRQSAHHVTVFAPDLSHRVELHVCLSPPIGNTRITFETIAPSLQRQSYFGVSMLTLPPEEMLVYLSLHGSSHVWERLEWLCCVAQLLRSGTMEWDRVHAFATRLNGVRRVQAAGYIVQALLGDRVPHPLQTSDRWVHSATRFVVRRLAEERTSQKRSVGAFLFQLRTDSCHTARMQRVRAILFTAHSGDMAAVRLPPFLRVLYQLVRPIRLLWKHGRNIVRRGWIRSVTDS